MKNNSLTSWTYKPRDGGCLSLLAFLALVLVVAGLIVGVVLTWQHRSPLGG